MGEVVCVLGKTVSDMVCCSHANPLLRALTSYVARKPGIACLGGAARARISPLTRLVCVGGRLADSAFVLVAGCAAPDP